MATNSSRGNPIAARDGPPKETPGPVPHIPAELKAEIHQESEDTAAGLHASGQDAGCIAPGAHVETLDEVVGEGGGKGTGKGK
jgi:hypothetical protein